jgi:uncharacterized protein YigA (DUF484 family)
MKRVTYHLTETQLARLRAKAKKTGLRMAELICRAVDNYLKQDE